jgi:hypothetical protein
MLLRGHKVNHTVPCSKLTTGTIYADRSGYRSQWDPKDSAFVHHRLTLPQSRTWIEVTHCHSVKRGKSTTTNVYWTYLTPNSGIRMFTGNTIGFVSHADAARSLNITCSNKWCTNSFHRVFSHYSKSYDTMYFSHAEQAHRCENASHVEVVWLRSKENKRSACLDHIQYRNYFFRPCKCTEIKDCIACVQ